jgi:hypothetical protein
MQTQNVITNRSAATLRPWFQARLAGATTAYLSLPSAIATGKEAEYLAQVRRAFPWMRIGIYSKEFEDWRDWRENFEDYMADVDILIIGCDSSRLIGPGCRREIGAARRAGKLIVLFKLDDDQPRRYYGYEQSGTKETPVIRLRKRAEAMQRIGRERAR